MKKDKITHVTHNHHYWHKILENAFVWLIMLLFVTHALEWIDHEIETPTNYEACLDACSIKHFQGTQLGVDSWEGCYVNEFDRTECIQNCQVVK